MTSPLLDQLEERAAELEAANSSLRRRVAELENETHDLAEDLQGVTQHPDDRNPLMRRPFAQLAGSAARVSTTSATLDTTSDQPLLRRAQKNG